ncbi:MAG: PIN domain-containing protein [Armatimonadota bacterium]|nr:PIN domain-containing protein [bacterium]MDW8320475.1 PIN domain-containing protein [Armatimonadota bacterium]
MLCDTGPLIALADYSDAQHVRCREVAKALPSTPLIATLPCLVEAMYVLGNRGGLPAQKRLWQLWEQGKLHVHCPGEEELGRIRELMEQYSDVPMDFADASVVAAAESLGVAEVFTVDSHFYVYRLRSGAPLKVVP